MLKAVVGARNCTPAQIAIAWVLSRGEDIVPLIGNSRRELLPENLAALDIGLSPEEVEDLDRVFSPGVILGERHPAEVRHLSPQ